MKTDTSFQLEFAAWPVFTVETGGTIRHANQAAITFFGPKLEGDGVSLEAIWADPAETALQFLSRCDRSAPSLLPLRYRAKGGAAVRFSTLICAVRDGQKRFVFQLLSETMSAASPAPVTALPDIHALGAETKAVSAPTDTVILNRQKLDCALNLARTVALDFNNALTSILGHTSLLLVQAERDHPWRTSLIEIEKAAQKGAEVTHHLVSFSRQEKEGRDQLSGNLNTVLRQAVEVFQRRKDGEIRWRLQLQPLIFSVKFEEAKIQQALIKVIENSVEAVSKRFPGQINITSRNVEISEPTQDRTAHLSPGAYVCIEVADDGEGMKEDLLPRVFEPFFTTKEGHRGLGLAWVYGVITNHRGGVAVSSHPGQGTSVRIYLPASQQLVSDTGVDPANLRGNHTILMVDDEDLLLTMGEHVLSSFGYRVLTANGGLKALETIDAAETPIDLVITDLVMPQMSGRDLVEQVEMRLPGVPILCTSGFLPLAHPNESVDYLAKPFTSQQLLSRVRQILTDADSQRSP